MSHFRRDKNEKVSPHEDTGTRAGVSFVIFGFGEIIIGFRVSEVGGWQIGWQPIIHRVMSILLSRFLVFLSYATHLHLCFARLHLACFPTLIGRAAGVSIINKEASSLNICREIRGTLFICLDSFLHNTCTNISGDMRGR